MQRKLWGRSIRAVSAWPSRDYYLNTDAKSVDTLKKFRAHVQKMFQLAGEPEAQAGTDADTVVALETTLAKSQMDNVKRRDPKNINNKFSLVQLRELTPHIQWEVYLKAVNAPTGDHYLVSSPEFFRTEEKLLADEPLSKWQDLHALVGDSSGCVLFDESDGQREF